MIINGIYVMSELKNKNMRNGLKKSYTLCVEYLIVLKIGGNQMNVIIIQYMNEVMGTIIWIVVLLVSYFVFMLRPQKKSSGKEMR